MKKRIFTSLLSILPMIGMAEEVDVKLNLKPSNTTSINESLSVISEHTQKNSSIIITLVDGTEEEIEMSLSGEKDQVQDLIHMLNELGGDIKVAAVEKDTVGAGTQEGGRGR